MKRRNREINIFNLSMMDVISGAMGAFLIIMIVLARYYKSDPDSSESVGELGNQIQQAIEKLDRTNQNLGEGRADIPDLRELLKQARQNLENAERRLLDLKDKLDQASSQIERLNKTAKELKNELTRFQSDNDQLRNNNSSLTNEARQLRDQIQAMQQQVSQAQRERDEGLKLAQQQTQTLQQQVSQTQMERDVALKRAEVAEVRRPFVVSMTWQNCYGADIDLYVLDLTSKDKNGKSQELYNPYKKQGIFWPGDTYRDDASTPQSQFGHEIWSVRDAPLGATFAIYFKLVGFNSKVTQQNQQCTVFGYYMYNGQIVDMGGVNMTTQPASAIAGFLSMSNEGKLEKRAATESDLKVLRDHVATLQPN